MKTRRKRLAAWRRGTALAAIAGTSVLIGTPRADAAGEILTPEYLGHGAVWRIPALSADGNMWAGDLSGDGRTILSRFKAV
ncbi:hypothetical protein N8D56_07645 [Devosia sp. A8/3-2]|nr:hypothetical protein N8D56_07645 [Devosia sp. A8/3-2]